MKNFVLGELEEAQRGLQELLGNDLALEAILAAGSLLAETFQSGGRVWAAGNGGSMCDAMHFAEELSGRYRDDRPALPAMAFSDPGFLTCAANDYGYDSVFARAVEAHARKGDTLLLLSTSGKSPNILAALESAQARGVKVIGLTGQPNSHLALRSSIAVVTPVGHYADRVQELHIKVIHILIGIVERLVFGDNDEMDGSSVDGDPVDRGVHG